jgi:hypothetical protein
MNMRRIYLIHSLHPQYTESAFLYTTQHSIIPQGVSLLPRCM